MTEDLPLFRWASEQEGPFANSTARPAPAEVLIAGLIWQRRGRNSAISIAEVRAVTGYSVREIKLVVERLIVTHHIKIGGRRQEPFGYFVVETAEDLAAAIEPYKSQILAMLRRLRVLDSPHARREFLGQIRMELEG